LQIIPPNWSDCANDGKLHFCSTAHPSTLLVEFAYFLCKNLYFDDFSKDFFEINRQFMLFNQFLRDFDGI